MTNFLDDSPTQSNDLEHSRGGGFWPLRSCVVTRLAGRNITDVFAASGLEEERLVSVRHAGRFTVLYSNCDIDDPKAPPGKHQIIIRAAGLHRIQKGDEYATHQEEDIIFKIDQMTPEQFQEISEVVNNSFENKNGNPIRAAEEKLLFDRNHDIHRSIISPDLGGIRLDIRYANPAVASQIPSPSSARDILTNLSSMGFLLHKEQLNGLFTRFNRHGTLVTFDLQGVGILDALGMGEQLEKVLKDLSSTIHKVVRKYTESDAEVLRLGGDEFALVTGYVGENIQPLLTDIRKGIAELVHKHFDQEDPRYAKAIELLAMKCGFEDGKVPSNLHSHIGLMKPYFGVVELKVPYGLKDETGVQHYMKAALNHADERVFGMKAAIKSKNITAINSYLRYEPLDWAQKELRQAEYQMLDVFNHAVESHKKHHDILFNTSSLTDAERRFHVAAAYRAALAAFEVSSTIVRTNRINGEAAGVIFGFDAPSDDSPQAKESRELFSSDLRRFGSMNELYGSERADTEIVFGILYHSLDQSILCPIVARYRGGRLFTISPEGTPVPAGDIQRFLQRFEPRVRRALFYGIENYNRGDPEKWNHRLEQRSVFTTALDLAVSQYNPKPKTVTNAQSTQLTVTCSQGTIDLSTYFSFDDSVSVEKVTFTVVDHVPDGIASLPRVPGFHDADDAAIMAS